MQAAVDPIKSVLVTARDTAFLGLAGEAGGEVGAEVGVEEDAELSTPLSTPHVARLLLSAPHTPALLNPLRLSRQLARAPGALHLDLLHTLWKALFRVCVCEHVHSFAATRAAVEFECEDDPHEPSPHDPPRHGLTLSSESGAFLAHYLQICRFHGLDFVLDGLVLTLAVCAGMTQGVSEKLLAFLQWGESDLKGGAGWGAWGVCECVDPAVLLYQLRYFDSARASALALLQTVHAHQSAIPGALVWYVLGSLRDCALLPADMVVGSDPDPLPPNIREHFELVLLGIDQNAFKPAPPRAVRRQSSSLLSLQGLGEALFGLESEEAETGNT
ncbi:hypothetical protein B484DRAFT_257034 [Ochromonadaceae sp. CCMP2298]|nr:hypothetical protein B484DRAFT_257034 [Ochromonadaceae sp. CCMP2298]